MWSVYILRCADKSFYTGIAKDVSRRLRAHQSRRGSKYVRTRLPVKLLYQETCGDRSAALKREVEIKRWPRPRKRALIRSVKSNASKKRNRA